MRPTYVFTKNVKQTSKLESISLIRSEDFYRVMVKHEIRETEEPIPNLDANL